MVHVLFRRTPPHFDMKCNAFKLLSLLPGVVLFVVLYRRYGVTAVSEQIALGWGTGMLAGIVLVVSAVALIYNRWGNGILFSSILYTAGHIVALSAGAFTLTVLYLLPLLPQVGEYYP